MKWSVNDIMSEHGGGGGGFALRSMFWLEDYNKCLVQLGGVGLLHHTAYSYIVKPDLSGARGPLGKMTVTFIQ